VAAAAIACTSRHAVATARRVTAAGQILLVCIRAARVAEAVHSDAQIEVIDGCR
jgi:hypothetical protein